MNRQYTIVDIAHFDKMSNKLCLSEAPGKYRDMEPDLEIVKNSNIDTIVCLMEWHELYKIGCEYYPQQAQEMGLYFYHLPIKDHNTPIIDDANVLINIIVDHLEQGHNVLVHCSGGVGRACTIVACCLCYFGYDPLDAINLIRNLRANSIKRECQVQFINDYHTSLSNIISKDKENFIL